VVTTSLDIWDNQHLHLLDHAWWLRRVSDDRERVWFVRSMTMPSLGNWLWRHSWPLMIALAVVLVLFLWQRLPRQGNMLSPPAGRDRDFLEHLRATARFLWRTDNRRPLLAALRRQVEMGLTEHPLPADEAERIHYLARQAGTSDEKVSRALHKTPGDRDELIEFVATLQLLRSRL
jgi:hypothetical protein